MQERSPYLQVSLLALLSPQIRKSFWLASGIALCYLGWGGEVRSQIAPDGTLSTNITTPDNLNFTINDGNRAGNNLFHSFREFSVPTGGETFFNNAVDIQNIFSRVTGNSISNIDGLIRANGRANLFLINPNGIIFGLNARLNIGGSFLGSTASSIKFGDGVEFSASNPQASPLLSINVPIGLQYGNNPGEIRVQGKGQEFGLDGATESFDSELNPLEVNPGKNLTILGGNVIVDGGILQAPGGQLQLGGLAVEGTVGLSADGSLNFPEGVARADISIINQAGINVLAGGGGSIAIIGRNIDISGESLLSAGIATGLGSRESIAGDIELSATEDIAIDSSLIQNNVNPDAVGNSGNISITTKSLFVTNSAQLDASTLGQGKAGNVTITASDTVTFDGERKDGFPSGAFSTVQPDAVGNAQGVSITAKSLFVTDGAFVDASTYGQGNAGSVTITASDTVTFDGEGKNGNASAAASGVAPNAVGDAGGVSITAKSLFVTNGAQLGAGTYGRGNAGSVTITASDTVTFDGESKDGFPSAAASQGTPDEVGNAGGVSITAKSLFVTNGAFLSASTFGQGKAGSITITASDTVTFDGESKDGSFPSGAASTVEPDAVGDAVGVSITAKSLFVTNGAFLSTSTFGQGKAGSITITASDTVTFDGEGKDGSPSFAASTVQPDAVGDAQGVSITAGSLFVTNGAVLSSRSRGNGAAGDIKVDATDIRLENRASIDSSTVAGEGDINLNSSFLILRQNSSITTNAIGGKDIGGGNIILNTGVLAALENSDITANAQEGKGGEIIINAQAIFGAIPRTGQELQLLLNTKDVNDLNPTLLESSDITAISQQGGPQFEGTIAVNTPDVDPSSGLLPSPDNLVDATRLVAFSCSPQRREQNQFIVTGRGGLPPNPIDGIPDKATWFDLRPRLASGERSRGAEGLLGRGELATGNFQIVEAQGWTVNAKGEVELVAQAPTATPHGSGLTQQQCYAP